jgi:hypothetical protein
MEKITKEKKMKYEFKGEYLDKVNGLNFLSNYNQEIVQLQRLNDDVAIYFSEKFYGRTVGTKEYFIFDIKKNQFVASTVDAPSKDYLSKYTNLKLKRVKEDV